MAACATARRCRHVRGLGLLWRSPVTAAAPSGVRLLHVPLVGGRIERSFRERQLVPYSPQQLYRVVVDVDKYVEFLPFCVGSRVTKRMSPASFEAELSVGFHFLRETYLSKVTTQEPHTVTVHAGESRIFDWLNCTWSFHPVANSADMTDVTFTLRFASSSPLHGPILETFFAEVAQRQIGAFQARCGHVWGKGAAARRHASPTPPAGNGSV